MHQIIGAKDRQMLITASDYHNRLVQEGNPTHVWEVVPNTGHSVFDTTEGRTAIGNIILNALE